MYCLRWNRKYKPVFVRGKVPNKWRRQLQLQLKTKGKKFELVEDLDDSYLLEAWG